MSCSTHHILHLARVVFEARTALSIGAEPGSETADLILATDANGLPALPASGLAGVLRALYGRQGDDVFGFQLGDQGARSRLEIDWGRVLDSKGVAVEPLMLGARRNALIDDPVLAMLAGLVRRPRKRDRVALGHRGTVDERKKFDRSIVPAGTRFAVELRLWSDSIDDPAWSRITGLLSHPALRVGGATRSGLGALSIATINAASLDLRQPAQAGLFRTLRAENWGNAGGDLPSITPVAAEPDDTAVLRLQLTASAFWRIGQGDASLLPPDQRRADDKPSDMRPQSEQRIRWVQGKGKIESNVPLFPASAMKGSLAHRVAFHANRIAGVFADRIDPEALSGWDKSEHCEAVRELFGYARDDDRGSGGDIAGRAGRLLFEDIHFDAGTVARQIHNVIDRFTGGVREHLLFDEELLYGTRFDEVRIMIRNVSGLSTTARDALRLALDDLLGGRLAIGAASGRGHGFFTGRLDGDTARLWPTRDAA